MDLREGQTPTRLKVNQTREIQEADHRYRVEAAGNFEPPLPSRVCDRDLRQRELRLSTRRGGSLEQQTKGAAAHPNESNGEADAKDNFQDVKWLRPFAWRMSVRAVAHFIKAHSATR